MHDGAIAHPREVSNISESNISDDVREVSNISARPVDRCTDPIPSAETRQSPLKNELQSSAVVSDYVDTSLDSSRQNGRYATDAWLNSNFDEAWG